MPGFFDNSKLEMAAAEGKIFVALQTIVENLVLLKLHSLFEGPELKRVNDGLKPCFVLHRINCLVDKSVASD